MHTSSSDDASFDGFTSSADEIEPREPTRLISTDDKPQTNGKRKFPDSFSDLERREDEYRFSPSTISRVKAKKSGLLHHDTGVEDTVEKAIKGQGNSSFANLGVAPWLVASLSNMAIKRPTGIQKECIPEILKGRDCIGGSRTGSGKTIAFAIPILQKWAEDPFGIFAVVLTPTRELALQIYEQFRAISSAQHLKAVLITGGSDMRSQAISLSQRPHIVIATPGRLADHIINSGEDTICGLHRARFVILDEADRLLSPGSGSMLPAIDTCLSALPPSTSRQTCLFTATITPSVQSLSSLPRPTSRPPLFTCDLSTPNPSTSTILPPSLHQSYLQVPIHLREPYLHTLLLTPLNISKSTIIFCNRTATATLLEYTLRLLSHRVTALHSALPQSDRVANLARFRAGAARILVATDVASRGLDIHSVGLVINYDLPRDPDVYIHRVGRTARAGREGSSVSLVGQRDVELVLAIEERVGRKMVEWREEGVSVEGRVVREGLKVVGEKKREALLAIEEGRDVKGRRRKGGLKRVRR
ncbi:MAG: putative RNA helicase [Bogoriella megaspora]|nr:MAG: putative RNA helicase [Bogoriella megaspora]